MADVSVIQVKDLSAVKLTVTLKVTRQMKFRMFVAKGLIWVAAQVLRCDVDVSVEAPTV